MKRLILSLYIALFCILIIGCSSKNYSIRAEVLAINDNILAGRMIGHFLGGSSGTFANDVIKVGVKFDFKGQMYLINLELNHAELVYYKDRDILDLILSNFANSKYYDVYLGPRHIKTILIRSKF